MWNVLFSSFWLYLEILNIWHRAGLAGMWNSKAQIWDILGNPGWVVTLHLSHCDVKHATALYDSHSSRMWKHVVTHLVQLVQSTWSQNVHTFHSLWGLTHTHTNVLQPFSRTTWVSRCQKKIFSSLVHLTCPSSKPLSHCRLRNVAWTTKLSTG